MSDNLKYQPPEIFYFVAVSLDSWDIGRLLLSGDRRIRSLLMHSIALPKFRMTLMPLKCQPLCFPNFSVIFPYLRVLTIKDSCNRHQFQNLMQIPLSHLPQTLDTVDFSFYGCERWFLASPSGFVPKSDPNLSNEVLLSISKDYMASVSFPSLKTLILDGSSLNVSFEWNMPHLAPNLESLVLKTSSGITQKHIGDLPPSLTSLRLLENSTFLPPFYHLLPRNLLTLQLGEKNYTPRPDQKVLSGLPQTLTELRLTWIPLAYSQVLIEYPSNLEILSEHTISFSGEEAQLFPPHLKQLYLGKNVSPTPSSYAQYLPRSLETLHGFELYPTSLQDDLLHIPRTLTSLSFSYPLQLDASVLVPHFTGMNLRHLRIGALWNKNVPFFLSCARPLR